MAAGIDFTNRSAGKVTFGTPLREVVRIEANSASNDGCRLMVRNPELGPPRGSLWANRRMRLCQDSG